MPLTGGKATLTAAFAKLKPNDTTAFRQLTVQNPNASGGNGMEISHDGVEVIGSIPADRSWTFGPNAGTITPDEIYIRGTADDIAYYNGIPA